MTTTDNTNTQDPATNIEGILRRVKKLLAIANDSRADPNEAAAAAGQAEKIMRKYQLDNSDVIRKEMKDQQAFEHIDVQVRMKREVEPDYRPHKIPGWGGWLAYSTAKLFDCEVRYVNTVRGAAVRFFGFKADVQVAAWTFDYLVLQTISAVRSYQAEARRTKAESESYRRGFALAVTGVLDRELRAKQAEEQVAQAAGSSTALVVLKSASLAEKYGEFKYSNASPSKANLVGDAYRAGREAGSKVQLRQGIGGNSTQLSALK